MVTCKREMLAWGFKHETPLTTNSYMRTRICMWCMILNNGVMDAFK